MQKIIDDKEWCLGRSFITYTLAANIKQKIWQSFVESKLPEEARHAIKLACEAVDSFVEVVEENN